MKCVPIENIKGRNFYFLKSVIKIWAGAVYVSGKTVAPLTLCHKVMRGK
jgi:hypothetical protein